MEALVISTKGKLQETYNFVKGIIRLVSKTFFSF